MAKRKTAQASASPTLRFRGQIDIELMIIILIMFRQAPVLPEMLFSGLMKQKEFCQLLI